jgi:hypothetical protein
MTTGYATGIICRPDGFHPNLRHLSSAGTGEGTRDA